MSMGRGTWSRLLLSGVLALSAGSLLAAPPVRVAAASSLSFALPEIVNAFRAQGGDEIEISYGSSGLFARQIARGAPFDLFLSANEAYVDQLARAGLTRDEGTVYAVGRLVLFVPSGSTITPETPLAELPRLHAQGVLRRLAVAHPEHAPYGIAARQALEQSGAWTGLKNTLVIGESVAQTARFVTTGAADAGLLAHALALQPQVAGHGRFALVPEALHVPLRQRMVLLNRANTAAAAFYAFLREPGAREILVRHGFYTAQGG
jgi:molybdate transport system substrate-binding protein